MGMKCVPKILNSDQKTRRDPDLLKKVIDGEEAVVNGNDVEIIAL